MELSSRSSYRGQLTKLIKSATDYLKSDGSKFNESMDNLDTIAEELTIFIDRLNVINDYLRKANANVVSFIKEEDMTKESEMVIEYEDKATIILTRLKYRLSKVEEHVARNTTAVDTREYTTLTRPSNTSPESAIKLTRLQPKKFSGDFREWIPFWEQFRALIHENNSISTIDKFNYLETVLYGKAAQTLAGLTPTEANYRTAITLLREEYGNSDKIIDHTMQQLLSIQPVHSKSDVVSLRRLYTLVLSFTRSLSTLGISSSNYFIMLKGVLLRCLPNELRVDFYRYSEEVSELNTNNEDSAVASNSQKLLSKVSDKAVDILLKFLKREIESLEKANEAKVTTNRSTVVSTRPVKTAVGLLTTEKNYWCLFCKAKNHTASECSNKNLSEKKEILKQEGRCYRCCRKGHNSKMCRVKIKCKTCTKRHVTSMCDPTFYERKSTPSCSATISKDSSIECPPSINLYTSTSEKGLQNIVYLQTAYAFISSETSSRSSYVRLVLDGGSQLSFVRSTVADMLDLPVVGVHNLSVIPFGTDKAKPSKLCKKVRLLLRNQFDDRTVTLDAIVVPDICADILSMPSNNAELVSQGMMLADTKISTHTAEDGISLLIGADTYWQIVTGEQRRITNKLSAINTILGWTIHGPSGAQFKETASFTTALSICTCEDVKNFWSLDAIGISHESNDKVSSNLSSYIHRKGNRFDPSLPWKINSVLLNDNRIGALTRMQLLVRKLISAGRLLEYDNAMNEMFSTGIAEIAPNCFDNVHHTYYLPHRPVYREDKDTTRLRIVFDASAHAPNFTSLNENLEVGDNLLPDLLAILLNFRIGKVGLIADVEKAFLQIVLHDDDRDSHRFFWFSSKIENENILPAVQTFRMTRVTFGVTCSPFLLCAAIQIVIKEAREQYPKTCEVIRKGFYMDDLIVSVDNEDDAINIYRESQIILGGPSMLLRKWGTNNTTVSQHFSRDGRDTGIRKVLGLQWIMATDELALDLASSMTAFRSEILVGTKRKVLRSMARIFDPFGIIGPWSVRLKILFQEIWKQGLNWDASLPTDLQRTWEQCCNEVKDLLEIAIPRHIAAVKNSTQLHIFADASQLAYGAVAYARTVHENGEISVQLICAKNRVAPLKTDKRSELTLPKLELTAALIASRLLSFLQRNFNLAVSETFLWSDSLIALFWIQGTAKRWKQYVENRVKEIRSLSRIECWRHCAGSNNPADLVTRGVSANVLVNSSLWWTGPPWLSKGQEYWPITNGMSMVSLSNISAFERHDGGEPEILCTSICNSERFSSWRHLLRVTSYVLRAVKVFKNIQRYEGPLLAEEIDLAEKYWISVIQRNHFSKELGSLRMNKGIHFNSPLISLSPFLDRTDGLLRLGGRLQEVFDDPNLSHPIILPKCYITNLIVRDIHEKTFHGGISLVLTTIRSKFWIIKGRQLIKDAIKGCFVCKTLRGKPAAQVFAPLPKDRILSSRPFEICGLDFAGPLYISNETGHSKKFYILLFTCAAVRAVHLESTTNLTTESFLLALRRFIARRGSPRIIYSDNAKTFKKASTELLQLNNLRSSEKFLGFLSNSKIKWKFIVERAPWWGGFWERLVGVVKSALRTAVKKSTLNYDQLNTLLIEVESVVNSRPLTYTSDDPLDLSPLTPAHFVNTYYTMSTEIANNQETGSKLREKWKQRLRFLTSFKKRWFKEYLCQLRSLHHAEKPSNCSNIKEGDVVLLEDLSQPRSLWRLAVVQKIFPGRDGKVRACEIRLSTGAVLKRPIQLLYPLELRD